MNSKLLIDNCPIIYYNKNEKYMPVDFDDILELSNIEKEHLDKINIIVIDEEDKQFNTVGKQILCKINNDEYIDLIYIITYLWCDSNPFDKSIIIVRLDANYNFMKLCCCNKENYNWYEQKDLIFDENRPVLFSSSNNHNLYNKILLSIFKNFDQDYTSKAIKWKPSEFVFYNDKKIYDINNNIINDNFNYYLYDKNIGNEDYYQQFPFSIDYDTNNMEAFYNNNGDIFNLFNLFEYNKNNISIIIGFKLLLLTFILFMIYFDIKLYNINLFNISIVILLILINIL